ncbi:hypothetical protein [Citrobacter portucalensis]|uniref:hypothetical protein n=1 Tax=Citrobacter portucalensis TaxID=1639133 RepID=UPI00226B5651|nr:hypothetical protein [Citrobacter portucalensis]MCX8983544.1 hypothetical protein [Citrobacter portucalensis]
MKQTEEKKFYDLMNEISYDISLILKAKPPEKMLNDDMKYVLDTLKDIDGNLEDWLTEFEGDN